MPENLMAAVMMVAAAVGARSLHCKRRTHTSTHMPTFSSNSLEQQTKESSLVLLVHFYCLILHHALRAHCRCMFEAK